MAISRLILPALLMSLGAAVSAADLAPGLIGEYFADTPSYPASTQQIPTLLRIDPSVNFLNTAGQFYKSKLAENFGVRWRGVLKIATGGTYQLATESDDGSRLSIDGKMVVDNSGTHGMVRVSSAVELAPGDHAILLEYYQGGGGEGCRLLWVPPGGREAPIPRQALAHDPAMYSAISWDEAAWKKMTISSSVTSGKYSIMDHGPFVIGTFDQPNGVSTAKGIAIYLDASHQNIAIFDPELMRFSYAGTQAEIVYPTNRDGIEGQPAVTGTDVFSAETSTGWARPGTNDFTDARPQHQGNLAHDWAFYHGLFLSGEAVTLSYSVGAAQVLEHPGIAVAGATTAVTRTLTLSHNHQALTLLIAEIPNGTSSVVDDLGEITSAGADTLTAAGVVGGGTIASDNGRLTLTIPAEVTTVTVAVWTGAKDGLSGFKSALSTIRPSDNTALTKGGQSRWEKPLVLSGSLGSDKGPYAVDTITVPYANAARSYMRLTGHDFFSDGRAAVSTMDGDVWIVTGIDDTLAKITWKRFATGLFQPLGLRIVDDTIYVTCRDRLVRLTDIDGDGEADFYESFNGDCPVTKHYHEFAMDLETDKDGNFYYCKGSNLGAGEHDATSEMQGCMLKVSKDGSSLTRYCTGLREPNGMGGGDGFPLLNSDNQGNWTPVDRINLVRQGGFYGFCGTAHRPAMPTSYDPPICWTPYNLDNSPGGLAWDPTTAWGPFKGMPVGLSYGKSCMFAVMMEVLADGTPQGGIVFFPLNFASGSMRARFNNRDHQLYVTGMRGWQTNAIQEGNFQRVRYTGKPVYMPTSLHIHPNAVEIGFPFALNGETAGDVGNFAVEQWNYRWTSSYGSEDYSVTDPEKKGHDKVTVTGVSVSADKKSVILAIPGLKPVMQMKIDVKIDAADGAPVTLTVFNTINEVPTR